MGEACRASGAWRTLGYLQIPHPVRGVSVPRVRVRFRFTELCPSRPWRETSHLITSPQSSALPEGPVRLRADPSFLVQDQISCDASGAPHVHSDRTVATP